MTSSKKQSPKGKADGKPARSITPRKVGPFKFKPRPKAGNSQRPAEASPARINAAGLVHIANEEGVKALPIHYYGDRSKWYGPNGQSGFSLLSASQAASLIAEHGFNRNVKDPQGNTAADRAMLWLIQNRAVAYAGPMAGYPAGYHETDGRRILVTESPRLVEPKPGPWQIIRLLIESMLADEQQPQVAAFYT